MTVRDDVRMHFESEAVRHPVPPGLRAAALAEARMRGRQRRRAEWLPALVAALLSIAIIAGLIAVGVSHSRTVPVAPPRLLFHEHLAANATGRPSLSDRADIVHIQSYSLAAAFPVTPAHLNAYAIDAALAPSPEEVEQTFGVKDTPQYDGHGTYVMGTIQYSPSLDMIVSYQDNAGRPVPAKLAHAITNEAAVIPLAAAFLVAHGLFSQEEIAGMHVSKRRVVSPPNPPIWFIEFDRRLDGMPDYGADAQPGATLAAIDNGTLLGLTVLRSPIGGSKQFQLIGASEAWSQVTLGHWYAADGPIDNGPVEVASFRADKIELCYRENNPVQRWLVPMWCFADTTTTPGVTLRLYYPALPPGSFDWTVPSR